MHPPRTQSKEVVAPDVFTVKSSAATYAAVMSLYPSTTRFLRPSFLLPSAASGLSDERFNPRTTRRGHIVRGHRDMWETTRAAQANDRVALDTTGGLQMQQLAVQNH
jgi:hypothetical protein